MSHPGFFDNFDDGVYAPQWTSFTGDTMIQSTYRFSGNYAMNLGGGDGDVASTYIDTSSCSSVAWRYYAKRGPEVPDSGENLYMYYWTGATWILADTLFGSTTTDSVFNPRSGVLTAASALHPLFRIRFQTTDGSGTCCDDFFIDDVAVGCNVSTDSDSDGVIDPFDCAALDPDHWNDCGACIDGDGDDYGTGCNLGPDCADGNAAVNPRQADPTVDGTDQNCNGTDGPRTQTFSASPFSTIFDNTANATTCGTSGATLSSIAVTGNTRIADVDVTLNISHAVGDHLDVWLRYTPTGGAPVCVELTTDNGAGANFTSTVLSDEGSTSITTGTSPFTGTFQPEGALSTFDGLLRAGTYTLFVNDDTAGTSGTLSSWSVTVTD